MLSSQLLKGGLALVLGLSFCCSGYALEAAAVAKRPEARAVAKVQAKATVSNVTAVAQKRVATPTAAAAARPGLILRGGGCMSKVGQLNATATLLKVNTLQLRAVRAAPAKK